ncbi:TRAF-type zinc finger family protein, partial [Reticulomyxa filosa]
NNKCPIDKHDGCQYTKNEAAQVQVNALTVICPRQYERALKKAVEGQNEQIRCDFKGKMQELNKHLNGDCSLRPVECMFKQFGCTYSCLQGEMQSHLESNISFHHNLTLMQLKKMQQAIQKEREDIQCEKMKLKCDIDICKQENERQAETFKNGEQDIELFHKHNVSLVNENALLKEQAQQGHREELI